MTKYEVGILVVGGLAGWWVISYLFDRKKTPGAGAEDSGYPRESGPAGAPSPSGTGGGHSDRAAVGGFASSPPSGGAAMSVLELQERWPSLLGVARTATVEEIEAAYARRRVELDRVRFSDRPASDRDSAARELRELEAAYEFVRSARSSAV